MRQGGLILTAGPARSKQKKTGKKLKKEIHNSPATATTSRRRAAKRPRVSSYSPASIDPGFVEIDLVPLSQSLKHEYYTSTDRPVTDRRIS